MYLAHKDSVNIGTHQDPDAGKDWRQEETGTTEDEMVGWHHLLNGHEFEQVLGNGEGQGAWSPWSCSQEPDATEWLNHNSSDRDAFFAVLNVSIT